MAIRKVLPTLARNITRVPQCAISSVAMPAVPTGLATEPRTVDIFAQLRPIAEKLLGSANQHYGGNMAAMARDAALPPAARAAAFKARHNILLAGKTGVVTGAAGNIGSETAFMMAHRGMHVVLADHPLADLSNVAHTCRALGAPSVLLMKNDLTTQEGRTALVNQTLGTYASPYAVVHCAGMYMQGGLYHSDPQIRAMRQATFQKMMQINLEVPVSLTEEFVSILKPGAHVTAINSLAGEVPVEGEPLYCLSKGALDGAWETMRRELGPKGIKLSQIFPSALLGKMAEGREGLDAELLHFPNPIARAIEAVITTVGNSNLPRIPVHGVISPYAHDHR